jgi:hypothetical protein
MPGAEVDDPRDPTGGAKATGGAQEEKISGGRPVGARVERGIEDGRFVLIQRFVVSVQRFV